MMDNVKVFRYCIAAVFLIILLVYAIPMLKIMGWNISLFDFMGISSDMDNFFGAYEEYTEFIANRMTQYRAVCVIFVILPLMEAAATVFIKGKNVFIAILAGVFLNNVLGLMLVDNINDLLEYLNGSIAVLFMDEPMHLESAPIMVWCIIHGAILVASAVFFILVKKSEGEKTERFVVDDILLEEVRKRKESNRTYSDMDRKVEKMSNTVDLTGFHGAIVCEKGECGGKVFMMQKGENVSLGSEDTDDIYVIGAMEKMSHCLVSYDDENNEYIVQPLRSMAVFMESGQPLGKNRRYCIPRGMVLTVDNGRNRFRLG